MVVASVSAQALKMHDKNMLLIAKLTLNISIRFC